MLSWELDRQVVLAQLHSVILALRSTAKFGSKGRFATNAGYHAEHPLLQGALELQQSLFSCAVSSFSRQYNSSRASATATAKEKANTTTGAGGGSTTAAAAVPSLSPGSVLKEGPSAGDAMWSATRRVLTETDLLEPFCSVCRSPETSTMITGVALAGIVAMLELPCSFITRKGLAMAVEAANTQRFNSDMKASSNREVLQARVTQVYVAAVRHPAGVELAEEAYLRMVSRALVIAVHPDTTPLLKRTAEAAMNSIVTSLYTRVVSAPTSFAARSAAPASQGDGSHADGGQRSHNSSIGQPPSASGIPMMRYISALISGSVKALDADGNAVSEVAGQNGKGNNSNNNTSYNSSAVVEHTGPAIQLEGLWLAQAALFAIRHHLLEDGARQLRMTVQNDLCRALLISGVGTTHVVVLAQILRTIHVAVKCASDHLVPQILSFLRVLHLQPLAALTSELSAVDMNSNGGFVVTSSPSSRHPASPNMSINSSSSNRQLTSPQIIELFERREILLESLAEFCSDESFCGFCYAHYDLSWKHHPVLPQLCEVLVAHACPIVGNGGGLSGNTSQLLHASPLDSHTHGSSRAVSQVQMSALDATANMVTELAMRAANRNPTPGQHAVASRQRIDNTIQHLIGQKKVLMQLASLFEEQPIKKGIPFLLENAIRVPPGEEHATMMREHTSLVLAEPAGGREVGACLFRLSSLLSKNVLGDYIGELGKDKSVRPADGEMITREDNSVVPAVELWEQSRLGDHLVPGTVRFFEEQLKGYIEQFNFSGKSLLTSIREMVYSLCLPGESQKIDRVMEAFATQWYTQNIDSDKALNPFHGSGGAFVLSFAIIMLNTDQHSAKVDRHMSREDFKGMNRGIDDGNNLPEEYLYAIYDDVRLYEVIMAEMMEKGFANDTTWGLEMNNGGLPGDIASLHPLAFIQLHGGAHHQQQPVGHEEENGAATARLDLETAIEALDPYVFGAVWKRCLLVFSGAVESAGQTLARVNPRGTTMKDALQHARATMPLEVSAMLTSVRGICMLARAAWSMSLAEATDQCLLTLLPHATTPQLDAAPDALDNLYRNLPKLLIIKEIFSLVREVSASLLDSWTPFAQMVLHLYQLGIFAMPQQLESGHGATIPRELMMNPNGPATTGTASSSRQGHESGGGGWLSALWGGGKRDTNNTSGKAAEAAGSEIALQPRVRECVPDMRGLLGITVDLPSGSRLRLVKALIAASSTDTKMASSASATAFNVCLITTIAVQRPTADVVDCLVPYLESTLRATCEACKANLVRSANPRDPSQHCSLPQLWLTVTDRLVGGSLSAIEQLFTRDDSDDNNDADYAARWELLPRLLNPFFEQEPSSVVTVAMAPALVKFIRRLTVHLAAQQRKTTGRKVTSPSIVLSLTSRLIGSLTVQAESSVLSTISSILLGVTTYGLYDPWTETKQLVDATLRLSPVMELNLDCFNHAQSVSPDIATNAPTLPSSSSSPATTASVVLADGTPADVLGSCCRNILRASRVPPAAPYETWHPLWIHTLQSLCELALNCAATPRAGSEALLTLQRSLLDTELGSLPAVAIQSVYNDVLFPLADVACAPRQGLTTPPPPSHETRKLDAKPIAMEVKCRVINLLPKMLLTYTPWLSYYPELLQELWQRVLGTMYAMYTAYPATDSDDDNTNNKNSEQKSAVSREEALQVREAVEETVKNMIFVVAATSDMALAAAADSSGENADVSAPNSVFERAPYFWTSLRNLIRPFSFGRELLDFMDTVPIVVPPTADSPPHQNSV